MPTFSSSPSSSSLPFSYYLAWLVNRLLLWPPKILLDEANREPPVVLPNREVPDELPKMPPVLPGNGFPKRLVFPKTLPPVVADDDPNLKPEPKRFVELAVEPKRVPPAVAPVDRLPNNAPLFEVADFSPSLAVYRPSDLSSLYSVLVVNAPLSYSLPFDELSWLD